MSFSIKLYKTSDSGNVINKTLTDEITLSGVWQDDSNILNPIFTINRNENILNGYNYAYIEKFKRFYFISNIQFNSPYFVLYLNVDVLESYKSYILASQQIITRQESDFNLYIKDEKIPLLDKIIIKTVPFGNSFDVLGSNFLNKDKQYIILNVSNLKYTNK